MLPEGPTCVRVCACVRFASSGLKMFVRVCAYVCARVRACVSLALGSKCLCVCVRICVRACVRASRYLRVQNNMI